jgi:hypothetical protein
MGSAYSRSSPTTTTLRAAGLRGSDTGAGRLALLDFAIEALPPGLRLMVACDEARASYDLFTHLG